MYNAFIGFEYSRIFMCMSVHAVLAPWNEMSSCFIVQIVLPIVIC